MSAPNMDKFNELTGQLFAALYVSFPLPRDLSLQTFSAFALKGDGQPPVKVCDQDTAFFIATAQWLIGSGFIKAEGFSPTQVSGAVLTLKGLEVLKAVPHFLTHGHSLRERLAETMREGGKETLKTLLVEELALGAKLITPALEVL